MSHPGYDLGTLICHLLGDRKRCKFKDVWELLVGFCEVHPLTKEEIDCIYYCIGVRTLCMYKWFRWHDLVQNIMVENGPKYTNLCIREAFNEQNKKE